MGRYLYFTRCSFGPVSFLMESFVNPGGEDDPIIALCLVDKFDEDEALSFWSYLAQMATPGDLFLDVGAYAGLFSLIACKSNNALKVAAFEASTTTYGRLVRNVLLNNVETKICAANYGVWSERETVEFAHRSGPYSMSPGTSAVHGWSEPDYQETVLTLRLDDLVGDVLPGPLGSRSLGVKGFQRIPAIKIDVEGAEYNALIGASQLLERFRPAVICELLSADAIASVSTFIEKYSYSLSQVPSERRNYLLLPSEKADQLNTGYRSWKEKRGGAFRLSMERQTMLRF